MFTNRSIATASPGRFGHIGRFCRFSIRYIKPPNFGMNEGLATAPAPTLAGIFNHRDNLNASLPVDDQQEVRLLMQALTGECRWGCLWSKYAY